MKTETIEEKTYRLLQIANKNDEGVAIDSDFEGEMFNSLLDNTIFKLHCKMIELAIAEEREVMEKYRKACKGLPDGAIDGGWTALGMSTYTRALEDALNNIICLETDRIANAYMIAGEALALRFHKISTEEREASGWISVKDRLPICEFEHEELRVMVSQTVNIYGVSVDGNHGHGFGELHSDGRWVCYGGEHDFMNVKEVTHWSPLPAAPKAEVSE